MAVDANFATELTAFRASAGTMRFVRLIATAGANNIVQFDIAAKYLEMPSYSVEGGLRMAELKMELRYDATSTKQFLAVITNSIAAM